MCNNVNNGIADFEVCGFTKNKKYIYISWKQNIFSSNRKIPSL